MRQLFRAVALLLAVGLAPGAQEVVEQALHLAAGGHTAHSIPDDAEHGTAPEHGCTATMHTCGCCPIRPAVATSGNTVDAPGEPTSAATVSRQEALLAGFSELPFQPPIA